MSKIVTLIMNQAVTKPMLWVNVYLFHLANLLLLKSTNYQEISISISKLHFIKIRC